MMRFMTNKRLSDDTRIEDLLGTTKFTPITSTIKSKVLKLYGHTKRCTKGVSKICLKGKIEGTLLSKTETSGDNCHMLMRNPAKAKKATYDDDFVAVFISY